MQKEVFVVFVSPPLCFLTCAYVVYAIMHVMLSYVMWCGTSSEVLTANKAHRRDFTIQTNVFREDRESGVGESKKASIAAQLTLFDRFPLAFSLNLHLDWFGKPESIAGPFTYNQYDERSAAQNC